MQLFIKTLTGSTLTLDVDPGDAVVLVKQKIYEHLGDNALPDRQRLKFNTQELLDDEKSLADYKIVKLSTLHLTVRP